jgi:two-component system, chemotaxis family, chemotaxis protein CheY
VIHDLETEFQFNPDSPASGVGLNGGKDGEPAAALPSIEQAGGSPNPNTSQEIPTQELESLRVLIVDDIASTRHFLRALLEDCAQFEIIGEASDGYGAIRKSKTAQPDVILLDISMPMVDGAMALAGICQVAPNAKVILVSGMDPTAGDPLLKAGASAFVPKGLPPSELLDRLGTILGLSLSTDIGDMSEAALSERRAFVCEENPATRNPITQLLEDCDAVATSGTAAAR